MKIPTRPVSSRPQSPSHSPNILKPQFKRNEQSGPEAPPPLQPPPAPRPGMAPSSPKCPQCGTYHPPLGSGVKCPMAPKVCEETGNVIDLNRFVTQLKGILESQIEVRKIKDVAKFKSALTVAITQFCEQYSDPQ